MAAGLAGLAATSFRHRERLVVSPIDRLEESPERLGRQALLDGNRCDVLASQLRQQSSAVGQHEAAPWGAAEIVGKQGPKRGKPSPERCDMVETLWQWSHYRRFLKMR